MNRALIVLVYICVLAGVSFAQTATAAKAEFKRLLDLKAALEKIPMEKQDREPHKTFLKKNDKDIVYSEPAGQWYVRSERFWTLHQKYSSLPIAEEIAWTAALNPIPGECEGYINCYIYLSSITEGKYLSYYPNGKYSKNAIAEITERLGQLAADDSQYDGPTEASDRAELMKTLRELKQQISLSTHAEKETANSLIAKLEAKYRQ